MSVIHLSALWILAFVGWFGLIPGVLLRAVGYASLRRRYDLAARLSRALTFVRPSRAWRRQAANLRALASIERGDRGGARGQLRALEDRLDGFGRIARLARMKLEQDWGAIRGWLESPAMGHGGGGGGEARHSTRTSDGTVWSFRKRSTSPPSSGQSRSTTWNTPLETWTSGS